MEPTSSTPSPPGNADSTFTSVKQEPSSNPSSPLEASSPSSIAIRNREQHYVAADSNSSSTTKSFVPCKVCGDKASGYHYGVTSCEGCKGFFRRSIQKQIEYRCLRDGKCLVIRLNRNRCQYCRFKKCLAVGMSRDSVRYGRVPKRSRERSTEDPPRVSTTEGDPADLEAKQLAVYDLILTISQAHYANCPYTEDSGEKGSLKKNVEPPPPVPSSTEDNEVASSTAESYEHTKFWLWQQFAINLTPYVQRVVEFAKRVPGFIDLVQDDQLILIKQGFFEIWICHISRTYDGNNGVTFDDFTKIQKCQLTTMYDAEFSELFFTYVSEMSSLKLNDTEMGLVSAALLFAPDRDGLTDVKPIEHLRDKVIEALQVQVARNHPNNSQCYKTISNKLIDIRPVAKKHFDQMDWFKLNWTKVSFPPLFAEIFDIPKSEDDL